MKSLVLSFLNAPMVKLVDTGDLKSPGLGYVGSIPARGTTVNGKDLTWVLM